MKKKPLRGSVRQNTAAKARGGDEGGPSWFGFWPRFSLLILGTVTAILFVGWLWHGAWPNQKVDQARNIALRTTQKIGFSVKDVTVEGRVYTDRTALLAALGVTAGAPTYTFDPQDAHDRIMQLPWTKSVTVLRSLPDKILVHLKERQPMARWQHEDRTVVIDEDGKELTAARAEQFAALPLVVGNAAPGQTQTLLKQIRDYPEVIRVLKAAVRVSDRRWNFHIQPDLLIKMPEIDMPAALTKLSELIQNQKILDRNIASIDLRIPQKLFIEPRSAAPAQASGETK